jgi:hypothetical protein
MLASTDGIGQSRSGSLSRMPRDHAAGSALKVSKTATVVRQPLRGTSKRRQTAVSAADPTAKFNYTVGCRDAGAVGNAKVINDRPSNPNTAPVPSPV